MEIKREKRRFDYITRFLAVGSLFNSSIYIRKVSNTQDNNTVLNNVPEPNII